MDNTLEHHITPFISTTVYAKESAKKTDNLLIKENKPLVKKN